MAITTQAAIVSALPGQVWTWQKIWAGQSLGNWYSAWTVAGSPGQGVAPSSGLAGDVPTSATTGAFAFINPASGNTYLGRIAGGIVGNGNPKSWALAVYDRLWHNSGISSTATTAQTVSANDAGAVHLTRPNATTGAEAWWEVYGVMGAGTPTVTLAYTDQDGNVETTGTSGVLATTMALGRTGQFQLAAGDTGVRSIQTWTASATFTSGTIGAVIRRLVTSQTILAGESVLYDALSLGLPRVYDSACLEVLWLAASANAPLGQASFNLIQG